MNSQEHIEEIDFQKYWLVLKRRWIPATGVLGMVLALTALLLLMKKPTYEAEGTVLVKTNRASTLTGLGEGLGDLEALNRQNSPVDTQVEIVRSQPILQETIETLNLKDDEGGPLKPEDFSKALSVKGIPGTDVLRISYKAKNPEVAATVVNKIIEVFIRNNVQTNRAEAAAARKFIDEQLPRTEDAVRRADSALREFKERNKIVVLEGEANAAVEIISKLEGQISDTQADLADATARLVALQNRVGVNSQQAAIYSSLSETPGVQDALKQLQEAQNELAVEQTRYRAGHPTIANAERRVAALSNLLQERISQVARGTGNVSVGNLQLGTLQQSLITDLVNTETQRLGLSNRLAALKNAQTVYKQRATILPGLEQTQRELERKLEAAQTTYEGLLTRLQEIRVAENQNIGNARAVSQALVPEEPVGPRKILILLAGGLIGSLLAIATAFALDLIDRSVKTLKEAKELFGYTLLGVIPTFGKDGRSSLSAAASNGIPRVITRDLPRSPASLAYQMLQANLKFLNSDQQLQTIVVTSSVAKEGKSEVAANLAAVVAQLGRRVLLVDADMHRPSQHHIWQLTNATGLTNVLVDQVPLRVAVQEVIPNLYILPSGVIPPNPMPLLDSKRMAALVDIFSNDYDFVIFDTPPLSGMADAAVLGRLANGVLLVVRPGVIDSVSANAAKEFLTQSGQTVLGMVINGVDIRNEPDSYFYYIQDQPEMDVTTVPQSTLVK